MNTTAWIILAIVVVVVLVAAALMFAASRRRARRARLREQFGPEYDRTIDATGDERAAERDLGDRLDRRQHVELHDIDPQHREQFRQEWVRVQASFVDDPRGAVDRSGRLLHNVMIERGYPDDGRDTMIDMISVDYPDLVPEFRRADDTTRRSRNGEASTEELRTSMLRYRAVFDRVLGSERATSSPA